MNTRASTRSSPGIPTQLERNDLNFPALGRARVEPQGATPRAKRKATNDLETTELEFPSNLTMEDLDDAPMELPVATPSSNSNFRGRDGARNREGLQSRDQGHETTTPPPRYSNTPGVRRSNDAVIPGSRIEAILEEGEDFSDDIESDYSNEGKSDFEDTVEATPGYDDPVDLQDYLKWRQQVRQGTLEKDIESQGSVGVSSEGRSSVPSEQCFTSTESTLLNAVSQQGKNVEKLVGTLIKTSENIQEGKLKDECKFRSHETLLNRLLWLATINNKMASDGNYMRCLKAVLGGSDDNSRLFKTFLPPSVEASSNQHCEMAVWYKICLDALFAYTGSTPNSSKSIHRQVSECLEIALDVRSYKREAMAGIKGELKEGAENKDALRVIHSKLTTLKVAVDWAWSALQLPTDRKPGDSEFGTLLLELVAHFRIIDQQTLMTIKLIGGASGLSLQSIFDSTAKVVHGKNFTRNSDLRTSFPSTPRQDSKFHSRQQNSSTKGSRPQNSNNKGFRGNRDEISARAYRSSGFQGLREETMTQSRRSGSRQDRDTPREHSQEISTRAYQATPRSKSEKGRGRDRFERFSDRKERRGDDRRRSSSSGSQSLNY